MTAYNRPAKFDRFTHPDATAVETEIFYTLAPFDNAVRSTDLKWGVDQLPGLVAPEMAQRYGRAVAALNGAIRANDPEAVRQNAVNCAKGLAALDRAATEAGQPVADPTIWEADVNGFKFAIIADDRAWPALKAKRPDLLFFTMCEVGNSLKSRMTGFAAIETEPPKPELPKADRKARAVIDDEIPF